MNLKDMQDLNIKCFNCGNNATAEWHGEETVAICKPCAMAILPRLLVDACNGYSGGQGVFMGDSPDNWINRRRSN